MKLKKLIRDIPVQEVKGSREIEITGVCANSKLISPGNLFIAKKGLTHHGSSFILEAVEAGAAAILTDIYDPSLKIVQVIHPNASEIEGLITAKYYNFPSNELLMIGITGTNGKTTTSTMIKYLLDHFYGPCGMIGTIEYVVGRFRYQATRTTPDVSTNQKMLREMVLEGCKSAVMEVTSHALDQGRVSQILFDIAVYTNLSHEHLDYHRTMEEYCAAKRKLFHHFKPSGVQIAVINSDCPWSKEILFETSCHAITYGIENEADLQAVKLNFKQSGTQAILNYKGEEYFCEWPLIGRFNAYNSLAAIASALSVNMPIDVILYLMKTLPPTRGRLEKVPNALNLNIFVDFAHSDDSLRKVLQCLQELKKGKILTVFGCGGDRDQSKRPKMAQAAEELSDFVIVTSDNPRTEDPETICREILQGFSQKNYTVEIDRRKAIQKAIELATPEDILLIAGKGHETYQIFAHKTVEFDDRKAAAEICKEKYAEKKGKV